MKGLNLGAGPIYLESNEGIEWENSDFADTDSSKSWRIDKKRDFTQPMTDIEDNSIDYILAWHIVEHMGFPTERDNILKEWFRVLKPNGKVFVAVPDLSRIAKHIVDRDGAWADWFICMVNVFGPYNGFMGDIHRWSYNFEELGKVFKQHGFTGYSELDRGVLSNLIGSNNALKLGFADYNVQAIVTK